MSARERLIRTQEAQRELRACSAATNDIMRITGGLQTDDTRQLTLNGLPAKALSRREHIVLLVIALHRRSMLPDASLDHINAESIAKHVTHFQEKFLPPGTSFWKYPIKETVHQVVERLRRKIDALGGNRLLIESGGRNIGYRLSTNRHHVLIDCPDLGFTLPDP